MSDSAGGKRRRRRLVSTMEKGGTVSPGVVGFGNIIHGGSPGVRIAQQILAIMQWWGIRKSLRVIVIGVVKI